MLTCLNTWPLAGHTVLEAVECRGGGAWLEEVGH